jgi:hypothetical protein
MSIRFDDARSSNVRKRVSVERGDLTGRAPRRLRQQLGHRNQTKEGGKRGVVGVRLKSES